VDGPNERWELTKDEAIKAAGVWLCVRCMLHDSDSWLVSKGKWVSQCRNENI